MLGAFRMRDGRSQESTAQTQARDCVGDWAGEQALQAQAVVTFVLSGLGVSLYLLIGNGLR